MGVNEEFIKNQLRQLKELSDQDFNPTVSELIAKLREILEKRGTPWSMPTFSEGAPAPPEREGER